MRKLENRINGYIRESNMVQGKNCFLLTTTVAIQLLILLLLPLPSQSEEKDGIVIAKERLYLQDDEHTKIQKITIVMEENKISVSCLDMLQKKNTVVWRSRFLI